MLSTSEKLSDFAHELTFNKLSKEVVHELKLCLSDTLACAIGGYRSEAGRIVRSFVRESGGTQESTIIGAGEKVLCQNAALANGIFVRYLDWNDSYLRVLKVPPWKMGGHPSECIPLALAVGEKVHATGEDIVTAIVLGYEVWARLIDGLIESVKRQGFSHATLSFFVAPLVAGKLLSLTEEELYNAVGISAITQSIGIVDGMSEEPNSMSRNLDFPSGNARGIMAALLAKKGFTGPKRIFEGKNGFVETVMKGGYDVKGLVNIDEVIEQKNFKILETRRKVFPAEGESQGALAATVKLTTEHDLMATDVEKVMVTVGTRAETHTGDPSGYYVLNPETATHSLPFLIATVIMKRTLSPEHYAPNWLKNTELHDLTKKITIKGVREMSRVECPGLVEIETKQGKTYSESGIRESMTDDEIESKFTSTASMFMNDTEIKVVINTINRLDKLDNMGELMDTLVFSHEHIL